MNIAIDGPAGAGKSTIAKMVAKELGSIYVDTGAMYRAMALFLLNKGVDPSDTDAIERSCDEADITIEYQDGAQHVFLNGEDVTGKLRTEAVGNMASASSGNAKVRAKLVELQQKLAKKVPVVMDGRDIGTVVLPDAELKIYLTAAVRTRAMRRYQELLEKQDETGATPVLEMIEQDIRERDERDMNRANSPLRQAPDAIVVDSSDMTPEEVTERILGLAAEKSAGKAQK
jgi:cytidylate kinase